MESESGWGSLPCNVLEEILSKVKTQHDYLQFELVCASWHRVAMTEQQRSRLDALPRVPMLLVPSKDSHSHSLYNVFTRRFSESKLVVPHEGRFVGSSRGWLVGVDEDLSVTLYKAYPNKDDITAPVTIRLPGITPNHNIGDYFDYLVKKVLITADPLTHPNECIVMIVFGSGREIALFRPNKDTHWTHSVTRFPGYSDILYRNDQFYALTLLGSMWSFKITDDPINFLHDVKQVAPGQLELYPGNVYLAESQGELVLIRRYMKLTRHRKRKLATERSSSRKTLNFFLYKLDVEKEDWVRIKDLSDVTVFLGDSSTLSIPCLDFPGCKPNRIYFTQDCDSLLTTRFQAEDFGECDLENGIKLRFGMNKTTATNIFPRIPIWFEPNAR